MRLTRRVSLMLGVFLAIVQTAGAQVANQLPADSVVIVKITNLKSFSTKVKNLAASMGIAQFMGDFADPLPALTKQLGVTQGLDTAGDLVMAMPMNGVMTVTSGGPAQVVILIPVTDYKTFIGNYPAATQEDGLDVFTFPGDPDKTYSTSWGSYAAISQVKLMLQNKPAGMTLTGLTAKQFSDSDLTIFVNPKPIWPILQPELENARVTASQEIKADNLPSPDMAKYVPVMKLAADDVLRGVERVFADSTGMSMSLNIKDSGITMTWAGDFDPDSYMGKLAASIKDTNKSVLTGLPAGNYAAFGGFANDPQAVSAWVSEWADPLVKAASDLGDDGKPLVSALTAFKAVIAAQTGMGFAISPPDPAGGPTAALTPPTIDVQWGDSAIIKSSQEQLMKSVSDIAGAGNLKVDVTPAAKTVNGVAFDETKVSSPSVQNGAAGGNPMVTGLAQGNDAFTAVVTPNALLTFSNVADDKLPAIVDAVKSSDATLGNDPGVAAVNALLPADRLAAFYFRETGAPANDPLIGMTAATAGPSVRFDLYISGATATTLVQQITQLYQTFGGGGAQPPPGGAGNNPPPPPPPMPGGGL